MKADHLKKVEARAERALNLLLPWEVPRGEVADPKERLRDIILRVDGRERHTMGSLRNDIWALTELLETDVPAMIQAVRDAQAAERDARRELAAVAAERAGTTYQVIITSDAPIAVRQQSAVTAAAELTQDLSKGD